MKKIQLNPDSLSELFIENIKNNNSVFVFSTDIVMNTWIDWIITHNERTGVDAIPFERFLAWDNFKRIFLSAKQDNLSTIPTLLKKFFVSDLIEKNAQKSQNERLQSIINPLDEYAKTADSFTDWICHNLPSLHFWKKRIDLYKNEYGELDNEDKDYLFIYEKYSEFLKNNNLFEPSWVENIEFSEKQHDYFIIYPEQFLDFPDFLPILEKADNITLCTLPKDVPSPKVDVYPDSRKELRTIILRIIELIKNNQADWSEIALSIPDIDLYRPYIEREFNLYKIPYVIKAGVSLTKNCAGRIFQEISDCYTSNFTFDSIRTLLLDEYLPWKDEIKQKREDLIREGNRMRCICSPYDKDIWLSAFNSKINRLEKSENKEELDFYKQLKDFYTNLVHSIKNFFAFSQEFSSFEHIRRAWMEFKSTFFKSNEEFSTESNNILSRCIKELDEIISIEQNFSDCNLKIKSPYDFFLQVLNGKTYTPQTSQTGVQIFKYKVSAAANFKYQFVIDASQKNLEVSYKRLLFLNTNKRTKLHLVEDDKNLNPTEVYMKLYAKKTDSADSDFVHYSCATDSFNGFAIPHSLLNQNKDYPVLDSTDYILQEKKLFLSDDKNLDRITSDQKLSFNNWIKTSLVKDEEYTVNSEINKLLDLRKDKETGLLSISARTDMENFFPCPRKWIFKTVLKLHDDTLDTNLMQNYDIGNLNHKILELFVGSYTGKKLPFYDKTQSLFMKEDKQDGDLVGNNVDCNQEITDLLYTSIDSAIFGIQDFRDSPLVIQTLKDQKNQIFANFLTLLKKFLLPFEEGSFGKCSVYSVEESYKTLRENFCYFGRIDTVLKTPDNDLIIIDYKNTRNSIPNVNEFTVDENGIIHDFQMPIYYILITENTKNEVFAIHYYAINENETKTVFDNGNTKKQYNYDATLLSINDYANYFTRSIKNTDFLPYTSLDSNVINNVSPFKNCTKCQFRTICRTTYTIGKKEIKNLEDK